MENRHIEALRIFNEGTIIPATPLALNSDRKFDEIHQRALLRYYLEAGVGGLAVAVHTTQFEIREPQYNLLETVLKIAKEEIDNFESKNSKVIVRIAGVCGGVEQAMREAKLARDFGYDAVLLSPSGQNSLSEEAMLERTNAVTRIIPVISFYLQTAVGGRLFSYNFWENICKMDGVIGIKAAPFNRYYTLDIVRAATLSERADKIALYTGNDDNIIMDLISNYRFNIDGKVRTKNFVGGLLGHWSVWTNKAVEIFDMLKSKNFTSEMLILANEITDCNSVFFDVANGFKGCIAGLHEVLRRQGLMEGIWCLNPDETLSVGQIEEIERVYSMYPHLNDDEFVKKNLSKWLEK